MENKKYYTFYEDGYRIMVEHLTREELIECSMEILFDMNFDMESDIDLDNKLLIFEGKFGKIPPDNVLPINDEIFTPPPLPSMPFVVIGVNGNIEGIIGDWN